MSQLKFILYILNLVCKVYSRRKAMEKIELARIFQQLSDEEKENFCLSSELSFHMRSEYIQYTEECERQESVNYTSKLD